MGVPTVTVRSGETKLDATVEILGVEVRHELNRIPEAVLTILDGNIALRDFAVSSGSFFEPGKAVAIDLRREGGGEDITVFEGLVVRHAVETRPEGSALRLELRDAAFSLTRRRRSTVHRKTTDDKVIRKLAEDAKLGTGHIEPTDVEHVELVQYNATDWDFIVSRADALGMVVDLRDGELSLRPMLPDTEPALDVDYGITDGVDFDLEIDGGEQWGAVSGIGWDLPKTAATAPADAEDPGVEIGDLDPSDIAGKLGGQSAVLVHDATLAKGELAAWASSRLLRSRLSMLRGRVTVPGRTDVAPWNLVNLGGVSARFDGKVLVSAVVQRVDERGWTTDLHLGLPPETFARRAEMAEVAAAGLLPPALSLHHGVIAKYEKDDSGEHRVKVALTGFDSKKGLIWARVAQADAGKKRGFVFWPVEGDEVVVGFLDSDPRQAIILGSMLGSAHEPAPFVGAPSDKNDKRALVSKSGIVVGFDDEKKSLTITTPGKNRVVIDDDKKSVTIADQHGNELVMSDSGITLKCAKDLTIDAKGKVSIKGSSVDIQ